MDNFTFIDRPDNQRLQLMKAVYSELNSDIVKLFIDFQWTYRNMQKQYDYALDKNDLSESRYYFDVSISGSKPNIVAFSYFGEIGSHSCNS
ncbi:transcriptional regulator [Clostridium beijerinckii]|uniref:hypothetical protein n=1 Tax=Clostridium beijerinckii TaxID=1520 RepID=UPI000D8F0115|nr:hypothetical protein [Clostridium beijerinckii]SQB12442.1 transcriptional regulator [Clostridium beijerinckii]